MPPTNPFDIPDVTKENAQSADVLNIVPYPKRGLVTTWATLGGGSGLSAPAKIHHRQIIKRYLFVLTSPSNLIIITKFFTMYFQYLKKLIIAEQLSFINIKTT
jgi:hypothetical protein